jgi:hypothetical protein
MLAKSIPTAAFIEDGVGIGLIRPRGSRQLDERDSNTRTPQSMRVLSWTPRRIALVRELQAPAS